MSLCVCVCVVNHCVNSVFTHVFSVRNKPLRKAVVPQKKLGHFKANLFFSDFFPFYIYISYLHWYSISDTEYSKHLLFYPW